jgi:hypothetical protein
VIGLFAASFAVDSARRGVWRLRKTTVIGDRVDHGLNLYGGKKLLIRSSG